MLPLRFDALGGEAFRAAITSANLREGTALDFKRDYILKTDEQKREFLADVTAMANTQGGVIVFGVEETGGVPTSAPGIELDDVDTEILRIEGVLQTGVEPKVSNVTVRWVSDSGKLGFLLIRIARSWNAPHRVRQNNRFYARNSAGKYPMDVSELRESFLAAEGLLERLRRFRQERLDTIESNTTPVDLGSPEPKLVLHILPFSAFLSPISVSDNSADRWLQPFTTSGGWTHRHSLDGYLSYADDDGRAYNGSYALTFRNGAIEAVGNIGNRDTGEGALVYLDEAEVTLARRYLEYRDALLRLGATAPIAVFVSLLGIRDTKHKTFRPWEARRAAAPRQDRVLLPEVLVENPTARAYEDIGLILDSLWQVYGYPSSPHWDEDGNPVQR